MRPPPSKLANCYIPLPWTSSLEAVGVEEPSAAVTRTSTSRASHALRRLRTETSTQQSSSSSSFEGDNDATAATTMPSSTALPGRGCAWVDWGQTKVTCHVVAPLVDDGAAADESEGATIDGGTLRCDVQWAGGASNGSASAAFAATDVVASSTDARSGGTGRFGAWNARREGQLRRQLRDVLAPSVPLRPYAKCAIRVSITILHDDGGLLPACVLAATLALQDAAIEMYDTITCCRVAVLRHQQVSGASDTLVADPDLAEEEAAVATVTVAYLPALKEVALWHQSGPLPPSAANDALALCLDGCRTLHRFVQQHWRDAAHAHRLDS